MKHCEVTAPPEYQTGKAKRFYANLCFEKAMQYVYDLNEEVGKLVKVCHGQYSAAGGFMANHAWVEIPGDIFLMACCKDFMTSMVTMKLKEQ